MSHHTSESNDFNAGDFLKGFYFTKLFKGFSNAIKPSKLVLALMGIILMNVAGWLLDSLTPSHSKMINNVNQVSSIGEKNHLTAYLNNPAGTDIEQFNHRLLTDIEQRLNQLADNKTSSNTYVSIDETYRKNYKVSVETLEKWYGFRTKYINDAYEKSSELAGKKDSEKQKELEDLKTKQISELDIAYRTLFKAINTGTLSDWDEKNYLRKMIIVNDRNSQADQKKEKTQVEIDINQIKDTVRYAQMKSLAKARDGQGLFSALKDFYGDNFYATAQALVFEQDFGKVKDNIVSAMLALCWLTRFHPFFAILLILSWLAVWSIFGGAICRMSALQFARDERIGPLTALKFSSDKFFSFFTAPLIPIMIVLVISLILMLLSLLGTLPLAIGDILTGLLMGLALLAGFIITFIVIVFIGGVNLMYPAISVEGSDHFDAISRSFSYIIGRPWHMLFYTLIASIYGAICFFFVRLFGFVMLITVRGPVQAAMAFDDASQIDVVNKMDLIWPSPSFQNIHPDVNFMALSGSESIAAFFIFLWTWAIAGLILSFAVSYIFSTNTTIYFLLRKHVDDSPWEDVHLEEDADLNQLIAQEDQIEESQANQETEASQPPSQPLVEPQPTQDQGVETSSSSELPEDEDKPIELEPMPEQQQDETPPSSDDSNNEDSDNKENDYKPY